MQPKVTRFAKTVAAVFFGLGLVTCLIAGATRVGAGFASTEKNRLVEHTPHVSHVLFISVDGLHQSDLAWYVRQHSESTLAAFAVQGVDYSNASTPFPSDSFPGMVGPATG